VSPLLVHVIVALVVFAIYFQFPPVLIYAERKVCARIQNRIGPNRVGPWGLLQPLADAVKLLTKEEVVPARAEKGLYYLAPVIAILPASFAFAVVPIARPFVLGDGTVIATQVADLNVGIIFVLAITSLGVYGIAFGGWSANSKYPLLGGIRSSAQLISYEIAMGLAIVAVVMVSGAVRMGGIVDSQIAHGWNVIRQPVAALLFTIAMFAENNRLPFDLPEAEAELVGGYHTEYSGMKFALFFMGEYMAMVTMSGVFVTLFLGGWHFPGIDPTPGSLAGTVATGAIFFGKVSLVLFFYLWVRWTLPRLRYDQLMQLGWKALIPIGLANILVTGIFGVL